MQFKQPFFFAMDVIVRILQLANAHSRFYLRIDNPPYLPLVIEDIGRNGPRGMQCVSVAHYVETGGVLRCRPEMLFEVRQRTFSLSLSPFYFRDDEQIEEGYSVFWTGRILVVDGELLKEHERQADEWNRQLETQKFEAAFRKKAEPITASLRNPLSKRR
jgi:hypothetical protein